MAQWCHVSPHDPCCICNKSDWCAVSTDGAWALCRRVDTGAGVHRVDKAGADYWLYCVADHTVCRQPLVDIPAPPQTACADAITRDHTYRALLAALQLSSAHRQILRQRGLPDAE